MLTLKEISEGFYKSTGATQATFRQFILDYLDRLYTADRNYSISLLRRNMDDKYSDAEFIVLDYSSRYETFILSPETLGDANIKKIPNWFIFRTSRGENILLANNGQATGFVSIVIKDLPNLESLEGLPEAFDSLTITNCPKIEPKHLAVIKRLKNLYFKPDDTKSYLYKDIVKYIKKVENDIEVNREFGAAFKKLTDIKNAEKEAAKKAASVSGAAAAVTTTRGNSSFPDVARANAEGKVMGRFKPVPVDGVENSPTWHCRQSDWTITDGEGNIIGFTTKKCTVIYRKGLKIMKFDIRKKYALDLHDNIIAKVEFD